MQLRSLSIALLACLVLGATGLYIYTANQLRATRMGISENIMQLTDLKATLQQHYNAINDTLAPQLRALIKEKRSKENLLQQATAINEMRSLIPLFHALPIPRIPKEVKESLTELFETLDPLLNNTFRDVSALQRDLSMIIPHIDRIIALEQEALVALKETGPLEALWGYFRG